MWDAKPVEATQSFSFPKIQTSTWPYVREVALVREDADFGVLLRTPYLEGQVDLLNLPDNPYDLLRLPDAVLNALRRCFYADLGVRLLGPGGVALYPFGEKQFVLYNLSDTAANVALRFPTEATAPKWQERVHHKTLSVSAVPDTADPTKPAETEVALTLRPFELALIERE